MKRFLSFILFYGICTFTLFSQGQVHRWNWVEEADSTNYQAVHDIAVDSVRGWVYVVGGFKNSLSTNFGGETSSGGKDGFISKFDTLGNLLWSFDIGGDDDEEVFAIDIDQQNGDIYIGGYAEEDLFSFRGRNMASISVISNISHGGKDAFVARYDFNGFLKWAQRDGGTGGDVCLDVCVDNNPNGGVTYIGSFEGEMELNSSTIDMGPDDGKEHMFIARRMKSNANGLWRGYSFHEGDFQRGISLTRDNNYIYLLGEYNAPSSLIEEFHIEIERVVSTSNIFGVIYNNYGSAYTSSSLSDYANSDQSIFYARLKEVDGEIETSQSWLYSIYGNGSDFAGDIKVHNDKLYIGGSVTNNVVFEGGPNDPSVVGNQAFVSTHDLISGSIITKNNEPNVGATTFSMVNSISFTDDYLVAGGYTDGTIRFDNIPSNDLITSARKDGFVAFYRPDTIFIETQKIAGQGTNVVNSVFGRGRDVFVGGLFGGNTNFDDDIQAVGQDDESGFVSLLKHRDCRPRFSYAVDSVCSESPLLLPNFVEDTDGVFSSTGSGLVLNSSTGAIDPFTSTPNTTYNITHTTFYGCSYTDNLFIDSGYVPNFVNPYNNFTHNTISTGCGYVNNYSPLYSLADCGNNVVTQIDNSGYTSGDLFPIGTTVQTWVVSDGYNPNDTAEFTITVYDNIIPEINFSQDTLVLYSTASSCSVYVDVEPLLTVSDNCGNTSSLQVADLSSSNGSYFTSSNTPYEIIYKVTDSAGNSNRDTIYVSVLDAIPPSFTNCINGDTTVYLSSSSCQESVDFSHISANDACFVQSQSWSFGNGTSNLFSLDTTNVVLTATDYSQNTSTCSFNVVVVDTITPTFTNCTSDTLKYYLPEDSCGVEVNFNSPLATDNCLFSINQIYGVSSGTVLGIVDLDSLVFQVNDSSANSSTCTKYYQALDTLSPTFINCPNDTVLFADIEQCGQVFSFSALNIDDNCYASGQILQTDGSGLSSDSLFPVGNTNLSFTYSDLSNNSTTCSFTVSVEVQDVANFETMTPTGLCVNSDSLNILDYINGYSNGSVYINGILDSIYTPGSSEVKDTIMYIYGGGSCQDTIVHYINLYNLYINAGDNDSICGLDYLLSANSTNPNVNSHWELNSAYNFTPNHTTNNPSVEVGQEGLYSFVWILEQEQCIVSDTVLVHFFEQPTANQGENQTVEENEVDLNALIDYGVGYWGVESSEGVIADSLDQNTAVTGLNLGLNTFTWYVSNGVCPIDSGTVRVFYDMLTIPNAFSPNGDGINDQFKIKGFELYSDATITIIDRWGETIYFTDQPTEAWDGTYNGKDAVEDTYFYILFINEKEYTGYIELRR